MIKKIFLFSAMTLTLAGCTIHRSEEESTTSSVESTNAKGPLVIKKRTNYSNGSKQSTRRLG